MTEYGLPPMRLPGPTTYPPAPRTSISGPSRPAEFRTLASGTVKYKWYPPDAVRTPNVAGTG